jgi:hypothetical protein
VLVVLGVRAISNIRWSFVASLSSFVCFSFGGFPCVCSLSGLSVGGLCSSMGGVSIVVSLKDWASYSRRQPLQQRRGSWWEGPARSRCSWL